MLGEMWDCQLGNLTAGKGSGGGGNGLPMVVVVVYRVKMGYHTRAGVWFFSIGDQCLNHFFQSATSDETVGGRARTHFGTMALLKFKYGRSLKTSPLLYHELCHILFGKCDASGSIRRPVYERWPCSQNCGVKLVEVEDDVNNLNKEGGSLATSKRVNLDTGYDSGFEDGSSKEPNVARGRRKKKSKKDSELGELEETMKNAIANIIVQENQSPTMEEYHEKLKSVRLEPDDPIYFAALGIFCQSKSYKEAWMLLPSVPNVLKKWIEMMAHQLGF
ncbi:hypothetical protein Tco_0290727 [Tanacetum coccineum]